MFTASSELESLYRTLNREPKPDSSTDPHTSGYISGIATARLFVLDECAYISGAFKYSA